MKINKMVNLVPPVLPPFANLLSSYCSKLVRCVRLILLVCFIGKLTLLSGCATKSVFSFDTQVLAQETSIRSEKLLNKWQFYSVNLSSTRSRCSTSTYYQSDSQVLGNTVSTTTNPVEVTGCFKGDDLTHEEIQKYKLLRIALTARQKGAKSFFRIGQTYWVPLEKTSYEQLRSVFTPRPGEERVDIQMKGVITVLNQIPHKKEEIRTSNRYFYHPKLNKIFDEAELTFSERMDSESEYEYLKRSIYWKPHYESKMSKFDPEKKGIERLIDEGVIVAKFHTEEALIPVFPEPLDTEVVIRDLSNSLSVDLD